MVGKLRSFLALPSADRRQAVRALVALPLVLSGLRFLGYARCHRWLRRLAPASPNPEAVSGAKANEMLRRRTRAIVRAVRLAERNLSGELLWGFAPFGQVRCLARSLTYWWLLSRDGVPAQLRVGVRREQEGIEAHAWVEVMGHPLDDAEIDRRYRPFDRSLLGGPRAAFAEETSATRLATLGARSAASGTTAEPLE